MARKQEDNPSKDQSFAARLSDVVNGVDEYVAARDQKRHSRLALNRSLFD